MTSGSGLVLGRLAGARDVLGVASMGTTAGITGSGAGAGDTSLIIGGDVTSM